MCLFHALIFPASDTAEALGRDGNTTDGGSLGPWITGWRQGPVEPSDFVWPEIKFLFSFFKLVRHLDFGVYWLFSMANFIITNALLYCSLACNYLLMPTYCLYYWFWNRNFSFFCAEFRGTLIGYRIKSSAFKFALWQFWLRSSLYYLHLGDLR